MEIGNGVKNPLSFDKADEDIALDATVYSVIPARNFAYTRAIKMERKY